MKSRKLLSPKKIFRDYSNTNGGVVLTRDIICFGLREGSIEAHVGRKWTSSKSLLCEAWADDPHPEPYTKVHNWGANTRISKPDWHQSVSWLDDVAGWEFTKGNWYLTISVEPIKRLMLKDVRFSGGDIKACLSPGSLSLDDGSLANFTKIDSWRRFWHEFIWTATNGGKLIHQSDLKNKNSDNTFASAMLNALSEDDDEAQSFSERDNLDGELAKALSSRHPFQIKESTVLQEVKLLRQALKLKRVYRKA